MGAVTIVGLVSGLSRLLIGGLSGLIGGLSGLIGVLVGSGVGLIRGGVGLVSGLSGLGLLGAAGQLLVDVDDVLDQQDQHHGHFEDHTDHQGDQSQGSQHGQQTGTCIPLEHLEGAEQAVQDAVNSKEDVAELQDLLQQQLLEVQDVMQNAHETGELSALVFGDDEDECSNGCTQSQDQRENSHNFSSIFLTSRSI